MIWRSTALLLASLAALSGPALAGTETPDEIFESVYGVEAHRLVASGDTRGAAAFADKLYQAAGQMQDSPALQALLCRKAYEFAVKDRSGYSTALAALELLANVDKKAPTAELEEKTQAVYRLILRGGTREERRKAGEALLARALALADADLAAGHASKAAEAYRKAYQTALAINSPLAADIPAKVTEALEREKVQREFARLVELLQNTPDNVDLAMQLLGVCLVQNAKASQAPALARLIEGDEKTARCIALASKDLADLPAESLLELAEWYKALADKAALPAVKAPLLTKAQACCEKCLASQGQKSPLGVKAAAAADAISRELDKLMGVSRFAKGWNLVADFTLARNPMGAWSCGWAPAGRLGSFKLFERGPKAPPGVYEGPGKANIWRNTSQVATYGVAPGEIALHGGQTGDLSIVRWTSPMSGRVKVSGAFGEGNSGAVDVYVVRVNSAGPAILFQKLAALKTIPFDVMADVRVGDKIDFVVGTAGDWSSDSTPLSATVVPKGR